MLKILYIFTLLFVIISCECADEIDTNRENVPNEFAQISVINLASNSLDLKYNNIELGKYGTNLNTNEYKKIESGRPVLSVSISGQIENLYSIPLSLTQNKYYSALIFNYLRYRVLVFEDDYDLISEGDFLVRLINLSSDDAEYNFSNSANILSEFESLDLILNSEESLSFSSKQIDLSGLISGQIYNIIMESDGGIFVSQTFR